MIEENKIISEALRLLIPEEINDLTDEFVAYNKVTLTSLLEQELFSPVDEENPLEEKVKEEAMSSEVKESSSKGYIDEGVNEAISTFILAQRDKLKESNYKLKEKDIQDLYKINANNELKKKTLKELKEDEKDKEKTNEKSSGDAGILIDKDHY
ncbi:MAG: hypothetical protein OEY33_02110 [Bdellovibrionales bacterium]|nr:hypothetical protein [Bdellovibrionales bacterium]